MTVKPITPDDIAATKLTVYPDEVIQAWNDTIAKHYTVGRAHFTQREIAEAVVVAMKLLPDDYDDMVEDSQQQQMSNARRKVFDNHWLDVEEIYREEGWDVHYDKPAYNEDYEAFFVFTRKK